MLARASNVAGYQRGWTNQLKQLQRAARDQRVVEHLSVDHEHVHVAAGGGALEEKLGLAGDGGEEGVDGAAQRGEAPEGAQRPKGAQEAACPD